MDKLKYIEIAQKTAINHCGVSKQLDKWREEVYELEDALNKFENFEESGSQDELKRKEFIKDIELELSDVYNMCGQLEKIFKFTHTSILDNMHFKMKRTMVVIEKELEADQREQS